MKIEYAAGVDIGPKETNDDRILVAGEIVNMEHRSGQVEFPATVVVCDGCGGYAGGWIAAETVLEFLSYEQPGDLSDVNYLAQVLQNCEHVIQEKKGENPAYLEMCTTVAGCVFLEDSVVLFHAGDSRVYRHDRWSLARMTRDHSLVQTLVDSGQITEEEALVHPRRNVINRCMGINGAPPEIYISRSPMLPGEKYLFCSDGLWESVTKAQIREILDSDRSLSQMVDVLIDTAIRQGSDDNISVCICSIPGPQHREEKKPFILD